MHQTAKRSSSLLLELLEQGHQLDVIEASKRIGISLRAAHDVFNRARKTGKVHVVAWRRGQSGPARPVIALGPGEDKPRPKAYTTSQKCRRWRKAVKKDRPDVAAAIEAKSRFYKSIKARGVPHDPIVLALLGRANAPHEGRAAGLSAERPFDAVVGPQRTEER